MIYYKYTTMGLPSAEEFNDRDKEPLPEFTGTIVSKGLPPDVYKLLNIFTVQGMTVRSGVEIEMDEKLGLGWEQSLAGLAKKTHLQDFISKARGNKTTKLVTGAIARILFTIGYDLGERLWNPDGSTDDHLIISISDKLRSGGGGSIDQKRANCTDAGIQEFRSVCSEFFLEGARAKANSTLVSTTPATPMGV